VASITSTRKSDSGVLRRGLICTGYYLAVFVPISMYMLLAHIRWTSSGPAELEFSLRLLLLGQSIWIIPLVYI